MKHATFPFCQFLKNSKGFQPLHVCRKPFISAVFPIFCFFPLYQLSDFHFRIHPGKFPILPAVYVPSVIIDLRLIVRGICEKYLITPPVIYRFKKQFLLHKKDWLGIMRDLSLPACTFLEEVMADFYSRFHNAFLHLTTYSFLQSHRNPANCERPLFAPANAKTAYHNL